MDPTLGSIKFGGKPDMCLIRTMRPNAIMIVMYEVQKAIKHKYNSQKALCSSDFCTVTAEVLQVKREKAYTCVKVPKGQVYLKKCK